MTVPSGWTWWSPIPQYHPQLQRISGLSFRHPFAAFAMLLFMLSLGGVPPMAGFMGKFWLFGAAIESGYVWLAVIGVLNSAVSIYYYVRIVVFMWLKNEPTGSVPTMVVDYGVRRLCRYFHPGPSSGCGRGKAEGELPHSIRGRRHSP